MKIAWLIILSMILSLAQLQAQTPASKAQEKEYPDFVQKGDSLEIVILPDIFVYPKTEFKNAKEEEQYRKLIRDVKKTLPFAKMIYATLIETYEYMETLPNNKAKEAHMKQMEKDLYKEYMPVLKKMSLSQGKLLIKLIDRECNQTSYDLVKAFLGSFRAGVWNVFASMFGASLKSGWDPQGKDAMTERIVVLVEQGVL